MHAQEVTLRVGLAADVPAMHALDLECFDERFRFNLRAMREYALAEGALVLLAELGTELAGFVIAQKEVRGAYVSTLDVSPAARRCGLARRLMLAAEARLATEGANAMELHVYVENEAAVRFYQALGYTQLGRAQSYYGRGLDAWIYRKLLASPL